MAVLSSIPSNPLRVGLGVLTLGFVATTQRWISLPEWSSGQVETFSQTRLKMLSVGGISGLLFGGTNIGIQLIAYLRSFNLSHGLFVSVVASCSWGSMKFESRSLVCSGSIQVPPFW